MKVELLFIEGVGLSLNALCDYTLNTDKPIDIDGTLIRVNGELRFSMVCGIDYPCSNGDDELLTVLSHIKGELIKKYVEKL